MKMTLRCSLLLLCLLRAAAIVSKTANVGADGGKAGRLRGQQVPGAASTIAGHYFGLNFRDSPFGGSNPWVYQKSARVVDDLDPTAPFDRLDGNMVRSWSGAAQVAPGQSKASVGYTQPDFVPPYLHPKIFPKEDEPKHNDGIMIPIEDQIVVAHEDRLRNQAHADIPEAIANVIANPLGMYPLTAPAAKIKPGPHPMADIDYIPLHYGRFIDQVAQRDAARLDRKKLVEAFKRADTDHDNAVSQSEFDAEVKGHQKKTDEQAQILWKQYHTSADPDMSQAEFTKLAKTGFDLGQRFVNRSDISGTLTPPLTADEGFWGGGAACKKGYVKGVQIKVQPYKDGADNTALNCVKLKCEDGSTIQTAEGPDGEWSGWAECLPGQHIFSVGVRIQAYTVGQDNTGINDLMFKCRSPGQEEETTLKFGPEQPKQEDQKGYIFVNGQLVPRNQTDVDDKQVVVGKGSPGKSGGWSEELTCGSAGALCGAQGRLHNVKGAKDNMGITDFRFFCCSDKIDCSGPCKKSPTSTDCKACKARADPPEQKGHLP